MPPVPLLVPYQGSKRLLAARILALLPADIARLHEPFAGSAAVSLAALSTGQARSVVLGDIDGPLVGLWRAVLTDPDRLAGGYEELWHAQRPDPAGHYLSVRAAFNAARAAADPALLLYLLARCVKAAVRYNGRGEFNQAADHRRLGARPAAMRRRLRATHAVLAGRTTVACRDFTESLADLGSGDVAYLDPPYQGVSTGPDARYVGGLAPDRLAEALAGLVARGARFALSYDGRCGERRYGVELPSSLGLTRVELDAGRSASATLHGRTARTVESLYLSPALVTELAARLRPSPMSLGCSAPRGQKVVTT